eukprot:6208888-Pleurochrysis_carterae.AAC.4
MVARHVEDTAEDGAEGLEAQLDRVERVADVAGDDDGVLRVRGARERARPLPCARVVVVHVRDGEDARRRQVRVAPVPLQLPPVPSCTHRVDLLHGRRTAANQLYVLRLPPQPV